MENQAARRRAVSACVLHRGEDGAAGHRSRGSRAAGQRGEHGISGPNGQKLSLVPPERADNVSGEIKFP